MITSAVFIALIGTFQFKATVSAAISYEPIKITVNENFNAQPSQVSTEFQSLEPGVVHQGANFYFKPRFNLPSSSISHHIEALMSLIQHHSCTKDATKVVIEKDKLMEILMPFLNQKESLSDTVMEEENSSEIVKPVSILITEEPKQATPELLVIPEAPVLPPISFNGHSPVVVKEIENEELVTLEESTGVLNEPTIIEVEPKPATIELEVIPEGPVPSPFSSNDMRIVEEVKIEEPPTLVDIEAKPVITELLVIPEAPVLPALSFNGMSSIVEQEVKKEESMILEESTDIFPTMPAITVGPEPIVTYVEPKSSTSGLLVIPEAPVLPSLSFNDMRSFVDKEVKKEESIILEESTGESQEVTIIEVEPKPATPELVLIPEAPVLPPLSANDIHIVEQVKIEEPVSLPMLESIVVDIEPKSVNPELFLIPEAPILPPLSFNGIPAFVEEEVKNEESVIPEESTGVLQEPTIIEVEPKPATPEFEIIPGVLHSLSFEDIHNFEEEMKNKESIILEGSMGESQEPTIIEPKPATLELEVIPETPVLPPLSFNGIPDFIVEEVKKKGSVLLEESTELFPEPTIIEVEPRNTTPQLLVIPEAPMLPPLSLNGMSQFVEKELKKEESIILEDSQEPTIFEIKSKPATPALVIISEAPVLPPLSANDIRLVEEEEIDKPITSAIPESIIVDIEPKPATTELLVIPEAPMLPPLSFNAFPSVAEAEVKKEESVVLEEAMDVLQEPTIIEVEPRPATPEFVVIPEAPVLPPISEMAVVEEINSDESTLLEESTGSIPEISARPGLESFVETETAESFALENNIFPVATDEIKIEMPILLEESIEVFPPIAEISSEPTLQEPEITNSYVLEEVSQPNSDRVAAVKETLPPTIIRKPSNNLGVFNYAPFLSHLYSLAPKTKERMFPKPASLERFLLKKHPFILPVTPFPKLFLNDFKSPILGNKNRFLYPTSYAHDVTEKRIAPNIAFKNNARPKRVKNYVRSNVPKGPSYL